MEKPISYNQQTSQEYFTVNNKRGCRLRYSRKFKSDRKIQNIK